MKRPIIGCVLFSMALSVVGCDSKTLGASAASAQEMPDASAPQSTISVEMVSPEIRRIKFSNPPVNLIVPETVVSLGKVVKELSADERVKVVVFTSGVSGYFFNHFDATQFASFASQQGADGKPAWVELVGNLSRAPFISIAAIHGRTHGGGNELTLAMDLRYASKTLAVFNQPEVGSGLFPGGGGTNHLTRLAGRDRALEVFLSSDDYDADRAEQYGWVTRSIPDGELDVFVSELASRLSTFDKTALITAKRQINAIALPNEAELLESFSEFTKSLTWPGLQERTAVFAPLYEQLGPVEIEGDLGRYIGDGNRRLQDSRAP